VYVIFHSLQVQAYLFFLQELQDLRARRPLKKSWERVPGEVLGIKVLE
jgi:hypothetical protein